MHTLTTHAVCILGVYTQKKAEKERVRTIVINPAVIECEHSGKL